jgi:hypothetical protein
MITKGSQRGGGQNLASHLLNTKDNEHVRVHELRGFMADDLTGAFKEIEAVSRGTKCRNYLFSLSLSPPEGAKASVGLFCHTINRVEEKLGLKGQPRAVVFHEKDGRRHVHCVWSGINAETMTARELPFFKRKLMEVSRAIYLENGWKMPRGHENAAERNPTNFTLAEWQQAKRKGMDPRWIKSTLQECWKGSDNAQAFERSLEERGFFLAKGDKRGHVVLDHNGDVYPLTRMLGLKTKEVRARLGDSEALKTVADTRKAIGTQMTPALRAHIAESRVEFQKRSATLGHYKMQMTNLHRDARSQQKERHDLEWQTETRERQARLPKGLQGLWHRITGKYQEVRKQNEREAAQSRERQAVERQKLIEAQLEQRSVLQAQFKELRSRQAEQLSQLRREVGRYLQFNRPDRSAPESARGVDLGLKLER